jgi:hypothetical protein
MRRIFDHGLSHERIEFDQLARAGSASTAAASANDAALSADHDGVHPNEQFVRGIYDAMDRRDGRRLASILRADSRWVIPGCGPLCGTYVGHEQIFDMWRKTAEYTGAA